MQRRPCDGLRHPSGDLPGVGGGRGPGYLVGEQGAAEVSRAGEEGEGHGRGNTGREGPYLLYGHNGLRRHDLGLADDHRLLRLVEDPDHNLVRQGVHGRRTIGVTYATPISIIVMSFIIVII